MSAFSILASKGNVAKIIGTAPTEPYPGHKSPFSKRHWPAKKPAPCGHLQGEATKIRKREIRRPTQAIGTSRAANSYNHSI